MSFAMQSESAPRILIVRVGAMGDVLHALPAVATLRDALPEAHIGWAIEPRWASLLRTNDATQPDPYLMPLVDAVHLVEAKQWNKHPLSLATARSIAALRRDLRAGQYDIAIDLQGTLRSAAIARMSSAARIIGSATPREALARALYRTRVPVNATHVVAQAAEILRAALPVVPQSGGAATLLPLLPRDAASESWWREQRARLCGGRPPVLLAATAGWGAKEWPPEKFAELAARLTKLGFCVLLNAPPQGADPVTAQVLRRVRDNYPAAVPFVQALPATLSQLIAATHDMEAVIAGDTGPLHLAEALRRPTLGLFGPTDSARTGPRQQSICLRDPESVTDHRRHATVEAGLARISVEAVMDAFASLVPRSGPTSVADA